VENGIGVEELVNLMYLRCMGNPAQLLEIKRYADITVQVLLLLLLWFIPLCKLLLIQTEEHLTL